MPAVNDQVLPEVRWASWIIVAILIPALIVIWGLPGRTADLWAWTFKPDMTAIFMGSCYGAGAYYFTRVATARQWHTVSAGVLSAAIFAALMLVVTLIATWVFLGGLVTLAFAVLALYRRTNARPARTATSVQ